MRGFPASPQEQAREAVHAGAALVDIRSDEQRRQDGEIPCATCIARNVLEWRLDPRVRTGIPRWRGATE